MYYRRGFFATAAVIAALALASSARVAISQENARFDDQLLALMKEVNAALEAEGANYRVATAEYITAGAAGQSGKKVVATPGGVGGNEIAFQFVPFDARRAAWSGPLDGKVDGLSFAIDQTADATPPLGGLTAAQTTAAIRRAMGTWNAEKCSNLALRENVTGADLGVLASMLRRGGSRTIAADIMHAGFRDLRLPGDVNPSLRPEDRLPDNVLAVTFIMPFTERKDGKDVATDIDGDGKGDIMFTETYYNATVTWGIGTNVDVESIALHETGHALGHRHFGNTFVRKDGTLDTTPMAVMNPVYAGARHKLHGTDRGLHCSRWASWGKR